MMDRNYILLPENIQRRPLPGHRHRPKKDKKVSFEAFSPISRAGRRAPGEAKGKAAMAGNTKKAEERSGADLAKFVRRLNKVLAARPAHPAVEQDFCLDPGRTETHSQVVCGGSASLLPQKRAFPDEAQSSTGELTETRPAKRARSNAISSSSRVKLEDIPRPHSPVYPTDVVNSVGIAELECANDVVQQTLAGEEYMRFANVENNHQQLPPTTNIVQRHESFIQPAVQQMIPAAVGDHGTALPPVTQPNSAFWGPDIPNHSAQPFYLNAGPAQYYPSDDEAQLERVALACAYAGMGEPMDVDQDFGTFIHHNDNLNLDLEHIAVVCAYAAMDEPMDITEDNTQGPTFHFAPQEPHLFNPPAFAQYLPVQQDHFTLQPPIYAAPHPENQQFFDHDQRLRPPVQERPANQFFHPELDPQDFFVMNGAFPLLQHAQAHTHHNLPVEEYFPVAPPPLRFDFAHVPPVAFHQNQTHIPIPPINHDQLTNRQFMPHFPVHEELINQLPTTLPLVDGGFDNGEVAVYQNVGELGQEDEGADHPGDRGFFVDDEAEDGVAFEERETNDEGWFEDLFGDESEDEGDGEELLFIV